MVVVLAVGLVVVLLVAVLHDCSTAGSDAAYCIVVQLLVTVLLVAVLHSIIFQRKIQ